MKNVLYNINVNANPELLVEKRVPDYVFRSKSFGERSVTALLEEGLAGMHLLALLMNAQTEEPDAQHMYNAVSQALSEKIRNLYDESDEEPPRNFLAAVLTIMDFIPFFSKFAFACAVELGYENLYDLLLYGDDQEIYGVCEMVVEELSSNVVLSVKEGPKGTNPFLRSDIFQGQHVRIVLKKDQPTGKLTEGYVKDILTSAPVHTRGIKVRLSDGQVGRVKQILN